MLQQRMARGRCGSLLACACLAVAAAGPLQAAEVIVDNASAGFTVLSGDWTLTNATAGHWGTNYLFRETTGFGASFGEVEFRPNIPTTGSYEVSVWYTSGSNRASNAPFTVEHAAGSTLVTVNQQTQGAQWVVLGTFTFNAGTVGRVRLSNQAGPRVVIADAVRFATPSEPPPPPPGGDEFRGMWVSRFEWPSTSQTTAKTNIDTIMTRLQQHRFNAVLFQMRGQADTFYPSPHEPWSPLIATNTVTGPGWDPMIYAINAAKSRGLEFHAYLNTHTCWQSANQMPPAAPNHLYYQHCNAADPAKRDWLIHDAGGNPVQYHSDDYVWIAPGVPAAQAYIRQQMMYVVTTYDVDGIHFDRIRSPGTAFSHDPISEARRAGEGNPAGLGFADWTRDQFTRMLCDLYAQVMEVKPQIKISSAPLGLYRGSRYAQYGGYPQTDCGFFYGYSCTYQDAQAWLAAGAMDFIVPQIYWADGGSKPDFSEVLPDWLANSAGRHIYAGQSVSTGGAALLSQLQVARTMGAQGTVPFSYSSFNNNNYWSNYSNANGPYAQPAATPGMPWKSNPTKGIIIGNVTGADGVTPVVDAQISRTGTSYKALSSGDGLYSFLLVDPGTYTLTCVKNGLGTRTVNNVTVTAGAVTRVNISYGAANIDISANRTQIYAGQQVSFTPMLTLPQGDTVISHTWRFGDGQESQAPGAPANISHVYANTGTFGADLQVVTQNAGTVTSNLIDIQATVPPPAVMDFDQDGDVDQADFGHLQACFTGQNVSQLQPDCQDARIDADADVDQADFSVFLSCMLGPNVPVNFVCSNP